MDYEQRTVQFEPVNTKQLPSIINDFLYTFIILMYLIIAPFVLLLNITGILHMTYGTDVMMTTVITAITLTMATIPGKWASPTWRKNMFSIAMYQKIDLFHRIIAFKSVKQTYKVRPQAIINNKYIIREFQNIRLDYTVTDDFATQLTKVEVDNLYEGNPYKWYAIFHFKQQPINGTMTVSYC